MIYFAFMVVLVLATGVAFSYGMKQRSALKALEPSEEDQQIIKALNEGTLTDEDLEGIGIDAQAFRAQHMPPTKQSLIADFRGFRFLSPAQPNVNVNVTTHGQRGGITAASFSNISVGVRRAGISVSLDGGNLEISTKLGRLQVSSGRAGARPPRPPRPSIPPHPPMPPMMPMRPMAPVMADADDLREYADELEDWERECADVRDEYEQELQEHAEELDGQRREYAEEMQEYERSMHEYQRVKEIEDRIS